MEFMISYEKAKNAFDKFLQGYELSDGKIKLKLIHTFEVAKLSEYIAKDLNLEKEDLELAKVIALLHDIGRFEQARQYDDYVDHRTVDHADYGVMMLSNNNFIRKFVDSDEYDSIILAAIKNHNKYQIESGLSEKELLHTKLIRDADKTDNFRVKKVDDVKDMANIDEKVMINQEITDEIYNDFLNHKTILLTKRKTFADMWVSYIAQIFDYNFTSGLKYLRENDYINILIDRFDWKKDDTLKKLEVIRKTANDYIDERLSDL